MSSTMHNHDITRDDVSTRHDVRDHGTETRPAGRTTELMAYGAAVLAIVVTAFVVGDDGRGTDPFGAELAIRYITFLTIGYMVARGLAKSGTRAATRDKA
jgi:hypothetical protein